MPRETVTSEGVNRTPLHLLAAALSLDDGCYFTIRDALGYLDTVDEQKARQLLEGALPRRIVVNEFMGDYL